MSEYIGVIDDIGNGQANMYVTDEPIVRCRDCVYAICDVEYCNRLDIEEPPIQPDGFCAWGERKDGWHHENEI